MEDTTEALILHKKKVLIDAANKHNLPVLAKRVESCSNEEFMNVYAFLTTDQMLKVLGEMPSFFDIFGPNAHADCKRDCDCEQEDSGPSKPKPFEEAKETNSKWFSNHNKHQILDSIRQTFSGMSSSTVMLFETIQQTCKEVFKLEIPNKVGYVIESFALNDKINVIQLDIDELCQFMLDAMNSDPNWCVDNILAKDSIDLNENKNFIRFFLKRKLFSNYGFLSDAHKCEYYRYQNRSLQNKQLNPGDIFRLASDTLYTAFAEAFYILDQGNILRKIGIRKFGSSSDKTRIIIPAHITRLMYDPIKTYAPFIHQHCFEDAGTIAVELQIDSKSHIFDPSNQTPASDDLPDSLKKFQKLKRRDWRQVSARQTRPCKDLVRQRVVSDYNVHAYNTVYIDTHVCWDSPLLGFCNDQRLDKFNLSPISENAEVPLYFKHFVENSQKRFPERYWTLLVEGYYRGTMNGDGAASLTNLPTDIIAILMDYYQQRRVWEHNGSGLEVICEKKIRHIAPKPQKYRMNFDSDSDDLDYDNLPWEHALTLQEFGLGRKTMARLDVKFGQDLGGTRLAVIESGKVMKWNGCIENCFEQCVLTYRTTGEFFRYGKEVDIGKGLGAQVCLGESKSDMFAYSAHSNHLVSLVMDFSESAVYWEKRTRAKDKKGSDQLVQKIKFPLTPKENQDVGYRFLVSTCIKGDSVFTTVSWIMEVKARSGQGV